jgi:hypothetical protein
LANVFQTYYNTAYDILLENDRPLAMNQERPWQNFATKYQGGTIRNDHIPPRKHTLNPKQIQALSLEQHFLKMTPCDIHLKSAKF